MVHELGRCPTSWENVYFANNEQASIAVSTAVFCFTHAEYNLIKYKLYNTSFPLDDLLPQHLKNHIG